MREKNIFFIYFIKLLLIISALEKISINAQSSCALATSCVDCYDWCPSQVTLCDVAQLRDACRVTCKSCPSRSEECIALNCQHRCIPSDSGTQARCDCFEGFELDMDNRTCIDIDECSNNPVICENGDNKIVCTNVPGEYICSSCQAANGQDFWSYYERDECCLRDHSGLCGKSTTTGGRIVNGNDTTIMKWPWMAIIESDGSLCGGTLLNENFVLTAAHCVHNVRLNSIIISLGVSDYNDDTNIHVQNFQPKEVFVHPNYLFPDNDIAIIRLNRSATIDSLFATPICLPGGEVPPVGERCYATGFGATVEGGSSSPILQEVALPIVDDEVCRRAYENRTNDVNTTIHICAGYEEGGRDSCRGDSGGPLVCQRCRSCDWYLAGIVSFGRGCARQGFYGAYTRVTFYEEWINQITNVPLEEHICLKPTWQDWQSWSSCSVTCGIGKRTRQRHCINGSPGNPGCFGLSSQEVQCNAVGCGATQWSQWSVSDCSVTCGVGTITRSRTCLNGDIGDIGCENGGQMDTEACNLVNCPTWNQWSGWSSCSSTCGSGTRRRSRICNTFGIDGGVCGGAGGSETESCTNSCWAGWGQWSVCSVTCNGGSQTAVRDCLHGNPGESGCSGEQVRTQNCNEASCNEWSEWMPCSATCGGGVQMRQRGAESETIACAENICPVWEQFGSWSTCSELCDTGTQFRTRACRNGQPGDDGCNGSDRLERDCNTFACNAWTAWQYEPCSVSCGAGTRIGRRTCTGGEIPGQGCIGNAMTTETCNEGCCPEWGEYGPFEDCSVTCGGGVQASIRTCMCDLLVDNRCGGSSSRIRNCSTAACPVWSAWFTTEDCSATCGGGMVTEQRICEGEQGVATGCEGPSVRMVNCSEQACPARWGSFGAFSECSARCGGGTRSRSRECIGGEVGTGECIGLATESEDCNTQACTSQLSCIGLQPGTTSEICCQYAKQGFCATFSPFMSINCSPSCCDIKNGVSRGCTQTQTNACFDAGDTAICQQYVSFCGLSLQFSGFCRKTCNLCS